MLYTSFWTITKIKKWKINLAIGWIKMQKQIFIKKVKKSASYTGCHK